MKHVPVTQKSMDLTMSSRVFNACWLSAGFGLSTLQMLLLAQAWRESQQALVPALLASAWALGSLVATRFSAATHLGGVGCLACLLLWLGRPALVAWHVPQALGLPFVLVDGVALALLAVLLGACGTAWLTQLRAWPAVGEKTALVRSLVGLVVGLLVAWLLPAVGGCIALACCLPLLVLDVFLSGRAPLPPPGGVAARWMDRSWSTESWPVSLERRGLLSGWRGLVQGSGSVPVWRTLPLLLQASAVAVVLGSVWGAVPTPFAASLQATHSLDVLGWLRGQLVALAVGCCCLLAARGVVGFPARVLPRDWQRRGRLVARLLPLAMAASLAALGDPSLQARWWLALNLAAYTLADAAWGILLPRLVPDVTTAMQSQGLLLRGSDARMRDPLHLAYARAGEASAKRGLAWAEGLAVVVWTPLLGWLIDRLGSGDALLVLVGLAFAFGLLGAEMAWMLMALARRRASPGMRSRRFSGSSLPRLGVAATQ